MPPIGFRVSRMGSMVCGGSSPSQGDPGWERGLHPNLVGGGKAQSVVGWSLGQHWIRLKLVLLARKTGRGPAVPLKPGHT